MSVLSVSRAAAYVVMALAVLLPVSPGRAAVFTVGTQPGCTHSTVAAALSAAALIPGEASELRLLAGIHSVTTLQAGAADVVLRGGYADCSAAASRSGRSILRGNNVATVLRIDVAGETSRSVGLEHIEITGGSSTAALGGGGILAQGRFTLRLRDVDLHDNQTSFGGAGIAAYGAATGAEAVVELLQDTRIRRNLSPIGAASHGGGIRLERTMLRIRSDNVQIAENAARYGGGVALLGRGSVYVGSVGSPAQAEVASGAAIIDNRAYQGGGLWLDGAEASLDAHELAIERNSAEAAGGGLYAGGGASISLQRDYPGVEAVQCVAGTICSRVVGNRAGNGCPGTQGQGGGLDLDNASAIIRQTLIAENCAYGSPAIITFGPQLELEGVLLLGNRLRKRDGFDQTGNQTLTLGSRAGAQPYTAQLRHLTVYGNVEVDGGGVATPVPRFVIASSLGGAVLAGSALDGGVTTALLASGSCNRSGLGADAFVDAANGDLRPASFGPLADACPGGAVATSVRDPSLQSRCLDLADVPDVGGACDIGALEVPMTLRTVPETTRVLFGGYTTANLGSPFNVNATVEGERRAPGGSVVFTLPDGERCTATLLAAGGRSARGRCELTPVSHGRIVLTMQYPGSPTHVAAAGSVTLLVERALSQLRNLQAEPALVRVGEAVTLRAEVHSAASAVTGEVVLSAGAAGQCTAA